MSDPLNRPAPGFYVEELSVFRIDDEFRSLIPPLSEEERRLLEESIEREGVRDPLVVGEIGGESILLDGHNRAEIASRLRKPYKTHHLPFASRDEAAVWIIQNQFGRRNLAPYVRSELALKLETYLRPAAEENQGTRTDLFQNSGRSPVHVDRELAKAAGVSHDTIHKVRVIAEKAPEEVKVALREHNLPVPAEHVELVALIAGELAEVLNALREGTAVTGPFGVALDLGDRTPRAQR